MKCRSGEPVPRCTSEIIHVDVFTSWSQQLPCTNKTDPCQGVKENFHLGSILFHSRRSFGLWVLVR
eukprot:m.52736 g.52736  ORF g.52736 m.52736 type:complete len:66 (-) comp10813_c0_seq2:1367-1564(-)